MSAETAREKALALLAARSPQATVCPSEVARAVAGRDASKWRDAMPTVHSAVDAMLAEGLIALSWKGKLMKKRAGPYRIRRVSPRT